MSRILNRLILWAGVTAAMANQSIAQTFDHHDDHADEPAVPSKGVCGTALNSNIDWKAALERTKQQDPETYQWMMSSAKSKKEISQLLRTLAEYDFKMYSYSTEKYVKIKAELLLEGTNFRLWVDKQYKSYMTPTVIANMARVFDTATQGTQLPISRNPNQGFIDNDEAVFGQPPRNAYWEDTLTDFFVTFTDGNAPSGGIVGGFFSPLDQEDPERVPASNGMNILYINYKSVGEIYSLASTLAHEYQHLIHYARKRPSLSFYNEGCSEVASILNGYADRIEPRYINNTNINFFRWTRVTNQSSSDEVLADYTRGMTWVHYLSEQFGERFLYELAGAATDSMARVDYALNKIGRTDITWRDVFKGFAAALYAQSSGSDSRYKFKFRLVSGTSRAKATSYSNKDYPSSNSVTLEPFGIAYYVYNDTSGAAKFRFTPGQGFANNDCAVMAINYMSSSTVPENVRDIPIGEDVLVSQGSKPYRRVVVAVMNMTGQTQTVTWTTSTQVLGVDNEEAARRAGVGFTAVAPNPVASVATLGFTTAGSAPVSITLYDAAGQIAATLADNQSMESGEHTIVLNATDLPNGVYRARLVQGEYSISRPVVVLK